MKLPWQGGQSPNLEVSPAAAWAALGDSSGLGGEVGKEAPGFKSNLLPCGTGNTEVQGRLWVMAHKK